MLEIYKKVFKKLHEENIEYVIYKSLNHLETDLDGNRGDIDILVDEKTLKNFENVLLNFGLKKTLKSSFPFYYFGQDIQEQKSMMIDIDVKIRLGHKPYRPYYYKIDITKLRKKLINGIWILDSQDYIPLMFFMRVTALSPKDNDLDELKQLILENKNIEAGYIANIIEKILKKDWNVIYNEISTAKNWKELQVKYKDIVINNSTTDYKLLISEKTQKMGRIFRKIKDKLTKPVAYRIRKNGRLIAFIGVDGAGKSSTVDHILNMNYFKFTGIKRIYFGNNEYWIPGLLWGLHNANNKIAKIFFALLAQADKSLRSLIAYFYIKRGYLVVADRFYYDDFIGRKMNASTIKETKSSLKKLYRKIFEPRILIEPDITIFLDVSPDVAYERKQDYSYEIMLKVNKAYKEYMSSVPNVINIDADKEQKDIYNKVISSILDLDKQ